MLTAPPRDAEVSLPIVQSQSAASDTDPLALAWSVHLLRGQTARLPRIFACALCVAVCGLLLFHNLLLACLPALALLFSLCEFLLPVHYRLTRKGAQSRQGLLVLEIAWGDVKHAYLTDDGVKLSPLAVRNSRLEPLRGVFLRFNGNEPAVVSAVRRLRLEEVTRA